MKDTKLEAKLLRKVQDTAFVYRNQAAELTDADFLPGTITADQYRAFVEEMVEQIAETIKNSNLSWRDFQRQGEEDYILNLYSKSALCNDDLNKAYWAAKGITF